MTKKPKGRYHKNLGDFLSADYDMASANQLAKQLTDAENEAEREAERQKLRRDIWLRWEKYGLDKE